MRKTSHANTNTKSRIKKAKQIESILSEYINLKKSVILDLGCGSGVISHYLGKNYPRVYGADVVDERILKDHYKFCLLNKKRLPYKSNTFDLVIANYVFEHEKNKTSFLSEIKRVLKPKGICYLSTCNRFFPIEPHFSLPFLSILPRKIADQYVRIFKRGDYFDIYSLNLIECNRFFKKFFDCLNITDIVVKKYYKYISKNIIFCLITKLTPSALFRKLFFFFPGWIFILKKDEK